MTAPTATELRPTTTGRLAGPDVVRAIALIGVVVMNYHGYLLLRDDARRGSTGTGWAAELFDPWDGPLGTRFAATFVLVAGVGVTLMTASSVGDRVHERQMRWRLVRRGLLLYAGGLALDVLWPGTILPFYGAMFVLAAVFFPWRARCLVLIGFLAAVSGWAIRVWRFEQSQQGRSTEWLTNPDAGSPSDHVLGVFVNGTHPLLPWLAFFCAGMVLGRVIRTTWWRPAAITSGVALVGVAGLLATRASGDFGTVALSVHPLDRGLVYTASALGTSLLAYATIDWLAGRFPVAAEPLQRAGQMTLTLYVAHVFVFKAVVDWFGWIEPAGLDVALALSLAFWVAGILAAVAWHRRFGMGPVERVYRAIGG